MKQNNDGGFSIGDKNSVRPQNNNNNIAIDLIRKDYDYHYNKYLDLEKVMNDEFPVNLGNAHKKYEHHMISNYLFKLLEKIDKEL